MFEGTTGTLSLFHDIQVLCLWLNQSKPGSAGWVSVSYKEALGSSCKHALSHVQLLLLSTDHSRVEAKGTTEPLVEHHGVSMR